MLAELSERDLVMLFNRFEKEKMHLLEIGPDNIFAAYWQEEQWYMRLYPKNRLNSHDPAPFIRPLAIGRKNWLFVGSEDSWKFVAILFSLVQSCRAAGRILVNTLKILCVG